MDKQKAVATLGQNSLLLPAWITAALLANDRLKLYLSVLQSAAAHAADPQAPLPDWSAELRQHGQADLLWLGELAANAFVQDALLVLPQLDALTQAIGDDLQTMAKPVCESGGAPEPALCQRREQWLAFLERLKEQEALHPGDLIALTHGERKAGDSLHLLVMDLHKRLNALSAQIATENIDGAHAWQIDPEDRPLIQAFMRGLQRTAPLKFGHPGLATAVTRHGKKLLIQNDIGTNDAHVLVLEVSGQRNAHGHASLAQTLPQAWEALQNAARTLEQSFSDMQDFEFTVQDGHLHLLQTRSGKRTPRAAVRIALDLHEAGLIDRQTARERTAHLKPKDLVLQQLAPRSGAEASDSGQPLELARASSACSGIASGEIALDPERAIERARAGVPVLLVRPDAQTDDIEALQRVQGLLTQRGARTAHAAVVARQLGKVCLVGCADLRIDAQRQTVAFGPHEYTVGQALTLDGNQGIVYAGALAVVDVPDLHLQRRLQALRDNP